MRPRYIVYLVVLVILAIFVGVNWDLIASSRQISFLVAKVTAPLGVLILVIAALVFIVDRAAHAFARYAWGRERRGLTADVERLRARADEAEESRIRELRELVEREVALLKAQLDQVLALVQRR
ncbi:MAG: hypothetical protein ACRET2_07680 [Steroidobacteraceae bacterium]